MSTKDATDYERSFGFLLYDSARLLRRDFDRRARTIGLTRAQWSVLAHLSRNEGINQAGLAEILDIEPITLGRLVDKLEDAGWVERRPHATDRRVYTLYLTAKAWPVIERIRALAAATRSVALAGISDVEQEQVVTILARIRANLAGERGSAERGGAERGGGERGGAERVAALAPAGAGGDDA
jgi:DNA-binding MarR family transcriptional regulator